MRKKPKDEPIDVEAYETGGGPLITDDTGQSSPVETIPIRYSIVKLSFLFWCFRGKARLIEDGAGGGRRGGGAGQRAADRLGSRAAPAAGRGEGRLQSAQGQASAE